MVRENRRRKRSCSHRSNFEKTHERECQFNNLGVFQGLNYNLQV